MSMKFLIPVMAAALLSTALLVPSNAQAQSGGGYDLSWSSIDSGAAVVATGGNYALFGTIGQPDAGPVATGGGYSLSGGFLQDILFEEPSAVSAWSLY